MLLLREVLHEWEEKQGIRERRGQCELRVEKHCMEYVRIMMNLEEWPFYVCRSDSLGMQREVLIWIWWHGLERVVLLCIQRCKDFGEKKGWEIASWEWGAGGGGWWTNSISGNGYPIVPSKLFELMQHVKSISPKRWVKSVLHKAHRHQLTYVSVSYWVSWGLAGVG